MVSEPDLQLRRIWSWSCDTKEFLLLRRSSSNLLIDFNSVWSNRNCGLFFVVILGFHTWETDSSVFLSTRNRFVFNRFVPLEGRPSSAAILAWNQFVFVTNRQESICSYQDLSDLLLRFWSSSLLAFKIFACCLDFCVSSSVDDFYKSIFWLPCS